MCGFGCGNDAFCACKLHRCLKDGKLVKGLSFDNAFVVQQRHQRGHTVIAQPARVNPWRRSEEHTSELQSQSNLVCRLLLEKKKKTARYRCLQKSKIFEICLYELNLSRYDKVRTRNSLVTL